MILSGMLLLAWNQNAGRQGLPTVSKTRRLEIFREMDLVLLPRTTDFKFVLLADDHLGKIKKYNGRGNE
jgi:hypothetical protein